MQRIVSTTVALLLCSFDWAEAQTQNSGDVMNSGRRMVHAVRLADGEHISIDGVMDESVWKRTATKPKAAARMKRLTTKKIRSEVKKLRRRRPPTAD